MERSAWGELRMRVMVDRDSAGRGRHSCTRAQSHLGSEVVEGGEGGEGEKGRQTLFWRWREVGAIESLGEGA
jgi:hypothetical protein